MINKKRIGLYIPAMNIGGAERIVSHLSTKLVQIGYDVTIVTLGSPISCFALDKDVIIRGLKLDKKGKFRKIISIRKSFRENKFDIILSFSIKLSIYLSIALVGLKIKFCALERSNPFYNFKSKFSRLIVNLFLFKTDRVIFLNKGSIDFYSNKIKVKSIVIPNAIFDDRLESFQISFSSRNMNKIVAVGRLTNVKRYDLMIKAFKEFHETNPNYFLEIYGSGDLKDLIKELIYDYDLSNNVFIMGNVENVAEHIKDSIMFIHTSESESWCNALMEAMSLGISPVVFDCDFGPRQMIQNNINGYLIPFGNVNEFVKKVDLLANNREINQSVSNQALNICTDFNAKKILKMYVDLIEEVLNE